MQAEQVIDKILADATAQAEQTAAQTNAKDQAETEKHNAEMSEFEQQSKVLAKEAARDEESHLLAAVRMEIAKEYLAEKSKILNDVFRQARDRIEKLPDEEYRGLMTKLMIEAIETGDEEVVVDKNDTRIDLDFIKEVNRKLGPGYRGNLRLAQAKQDIGGGFILKRGKIRTNVSIAVLIDQARKDLEIELAAQLFA